MKSPAPRNVYPFSLGNIGEASRCRAVMSRLTTISGAFDLERSLQPEEVKQMSQDEIEPYLLPVDFPLIHFGKCTMPKDRALYFVSGNSIRWHQIGVTKAPEEGLSGRNPRDIAYGQMYCVYEQESGLFHQEQAIARKKKRTKGR